MNASHRSTKSTRWKHDRPRPYSRISLAITSTRLARRGKRRITQGSAAAAANLTGAKFELRYLRQHGSRWSTSYFTSVTRRSGSE